MMEAQQHVADKVGKRDGNVQIEFLLVSGFGRVFFGGGGDVCRQS